LREVRKLRVTENRLLRRIFVPKRDEVTESEENYIIRSIIIYTPHQILFGDEIEKNEMGGACRKCGERRGAYRILVGKPEGKNSVRVTRNLTIKFLYVSLES
jgi:hypothetical protein